MYRPATLNDADKPVGKVTSLQLCLAWLGGLKRYGSADLTPMCLGAITRPVRGRDVFVTRGKWKIAAVAAVLIVIASSALWYLESPAWTLKGMKDAAQSHDVDALNAYIDYPVLRESLKAELMARVTAEAQKDKSGLGVLGLAVGSAMLGPLIDRLVSPAGVRAALLANRQENMGSAASALRLPQEPVIVRRGFSEFVVTTKRQPGSALVFKRHGLSWRLSGVELPPEKST